MASGSSLPAFILYPVIALSLAGAVTDLLKGRIYNWLTFPAILIGIAASVAWRGWGGLGDSFLGVGLGFALYGWMFWLGFMGGGDVKLLMALGAWGGARYATEVALLGVLLGGAMALVVLLFSGKLGAFARKMYRFLLTVFIRELELEPPKIDRKLTMPYGVPIAAAAICVAVLDPFEKWGLRLW